MMGNLVKDVWQWLKNNAAPVAVIIMCMGVGLVIYSYIHPPKLSEAALARGDSTEADKLFARIAQKTDPTIKTAAETAYQRCLIAFGSVRYSIAYGHCKRAVGLAPGNTTYLNRAGLVANTLGEYDKAIEYFEQALASDLKTLGENHPSVATGRNNIGEAWRAKGEYDKAIEYYEQALASNLKTFGEDHPDVATYRNNLGLAWYSKGEYDKAIEYYEQALASNLKTLGENHPNVALFRSNLAAARAKRNNLSN